MSMKRYIVGLVTILAVFGFGYVGLQTYQGDVSVGGDLVTPIAGQTYTLAGSGMSSSDTSFTLSSFTITQNGYPIQDSDMSEVFYITLEPGSRARQEIISCTTVGANTGGPVLISGCVRGLSPITPYTASTSLAFAHSGGSTVIFSDPPQLFNQAAFKDNDETITGNWIIGAPLSSDSIANKAYVDALVSGTTTLSNDRLVVAGTAGETLATSTLVYFNPATQRWNGVSSASSTTFDDRFIGLTQGAGTNGAAVRNGILLKGRHALSTGLTPGALYYASTATGTMSTATSAQTVGVAVSATVMYFDPIWIDVPTENGDNTFTGSNTFNGNVFFNASTTGAFNALVTTFNASGTWSRATNTRMIRVQAWGGGGGGGSGSASNNGSGGGGGGYFEAFFHVSQTTATTSVVIGLGGTPGNAGGNTTFGSLVTAFGGTAGSGGVVTPVGGNGGDILSGATLFRGSGQSGNLGGNGNLYGGGGGGSTSGTTGLAGGNALYGGAGGSGSGTVSSPAGGTSVYGGAGGAGGTDVAAGNGVQPGGGGGGANDGTAGSGAAGRVIVTEFF